MGSKQKLLMMLFVIILLGCSNLEQINELEPNIQDSVDSEVVEVTSVVSTMQSVSPIAILTPLSTPSSVPTLATMEDETANIENSVITVTEQIAPLLTPVLTQPIQISSVIPDENRRAYTPDNIWWSEDSQTIFYQNADTREAWMYDVVTGEQSEISYTSRSLNELRGELASQIPPNADIYSISSQKRLVLFVTPLDEPILLDPTESDKEFSSAYVAELWLSKNQEAYRLGMVDTCFLLHKPKWSIQENHAVVDAYFSPDVQRPCISNNWIIDLDSLVVEPLWFEGSDTYRAFDISADGRYILLGLINRNSYQIILDWQTKEQFVVPNSDGSGLLIEDDSVLVSLVNIIEFTGQQFSVQDYVSEVWYSVSGSDRSELLVTFDGYINQAIISPNQEFVVYVLTDIEGYRENSSGMSGIWLVELP